MVATSFGCARSETSQMIGPSKLPWMAYVPRNARSEFIDCSNPLGGGTLACMRMAPSASAASVFPALSPTRGSDMGDGAPVVVPAQASAVVRRQAAMRRAGIEIGEVIIFIYKEGPVRGVVGIEYWPSTLSKSKVGPIKPFPYVLGEPLVRSRSCPRC